MTGIINRLFFPFSVGRPKFPADFRAKNPPDWIIDFHAQGLPHGRRRSIQVFLNEIPVSGRAEIHYRPRKKEQADRERRLTWVLTTEVVEQVLDMLDSLFPTRIASVKSTVFDGIPAILTIYRRVPYLAVVARCNIVEWYSPEIAESLHPGVEIPPVARISGLLLDIEREALGDD